MSSLLYLALCGVIYRRTVSLPSTSSIPISAWVVAQAPSGSLLCVRRRSCMERLPSRQRVITMRFRRSIVRPGLSPLQNSTMHGWRRCTCDGSFHRNYLLFSRRTDSVWSAETATIPVPISPVKADYRSVNVNLSDGGSAAQTHRRLCQGLRLELVEWSVRRYDAGTRGKYK